MNGPPEGQVWDSRASVLVERMRPFVAWARDRQGARIEAPMLLDLLSLSSLESVLLDRTLPLPGPEGKMESVDLDGMPEGVFTALANFLEGTPAWYGHRCSQSPRHELVREQHRYVLLSVSPHLPALLV